MTTSAESTQDERKLAKDWLLAVEKAFSDSWQKQAKMPTFGRARPDVHRILALVGYGGSGVTAQFGDQLFQSTDGDIIELNGIPIFRSEDAEPGCVELGVGAYLTDIGNVFARVTIGTGASVTDRAEPGGK